MSGKVFSSPGLSSRPLSLWDRWVEFWRSQRFGYNRYTPRRILAILRLKLRRRDKRFDALVKALEGGGYHPGPSQLDRQLSYSVYGPLKVESLEATMLNVTFDPEHIRAWKRKQKK